MNKRAYNLNIGDVFRFIEDGPTYYVEGFIDTASKAHLLIYSCLCQSSGSTHRSFYATRSSVIVLIDE